MRAYVQITVARQTHAYTAWLAIFTVIAFSVLAIIRVMNMIVGFFLGILVAIVLLLGQFEWPAYLLWHSVSNTLADSFLLAWPIFGRGLCHPEMQKA